ncbi:MAG: hypothetical protein RL033_6183, partial [Pseudomonadota bacterium]
MRSAAKDTLMKHASYFRLLPCVLIAISAPLLGHCGRVDDSTSITETGNPPVLTQQGLHLLARGGDVEVVGDPGAIPLGATVTVTNLMTGDRAEERARDDGSVSIIVPGSPQDPYEVTVTSRTGASTLRISGNA